MIFFLYIIALGLAVSVSFDTDVVNNRNAQEVNKDPLLVDPDVFLHPGVHVREQYCNQATRMNVTWHQMWVNHLRGFKETVILRYGPLRRRGCFIVLV